MNEPTATPGFRRRLILAQRAGRLLLLAFVVAGVAGLLGGFGPLARQVVAVGEQVSIQLPRFVRIQTPFTLTAERSQPSGQPWRLALSNDLIADLAIEDISPKPLASQWSAQGLELEFGAATTRVSLRARSDAAGRTGGHVRVNTGEPVAIPLWTYP